MEIKKYRSIAKLVTPESGNKIRIYDTIVLNSPSLKGKKTPQYENTSPNCRKTEDIVYENIRLTTKKTPSSSIIAKNFEKTTSFLLSGVSSSLHKVPLLSSYIKRSYTLMQEKIIEKTVVISSEKRGKF